MARSLTDLEISATMVLFAVAATDTTRHTASFAVKALTDFPEQRQWLWEDFEDRIDSAIEEFLRWGSVVLNFRRTAVAEYELNGQKILPGDKVVMMYPSGNRDAEVFDHPDTFDLARTPQRPRRIRRRRAPLLPGQPARQIDAAVTIPGTAPTDARLRRRRADTDENQLHARRRQLAIRAQPGFPTMTTAPNPTTSSLDALSRTSDQLYDDLLLPDETVKIRAEAREFATTVLASRAAELNSAEESKAAFPRDILDAMAAAGLYTIPFASDVGGRGLQYPMLAAATVLEELAYYTPGVASALYDGQALLVRARLMRLPPTSAASICPASCAVRSSAPSPPASPTPAPTCRRTRCVPRRHGSPADTVSTAVNDGSPTRARPTS